MKYRERIHNELKEYSKSFPLTRRQLETVETFANLDLSQTDRIMCDRYSKFGPSPRQPSDMLRSMLLCMYEGRGNYSYTQWAEHLKTSPFLAIVSGFEPRDVPGVGTFYDFLDRLWLGTQNNFLPHERPKRVRPPKPKRKGEKAPPVEKKPVEKVIEAYEKEPSNPLQPCELLWELLDANFLQVSEQMGLIDFHNLLLAGDGTPVCTSARERTQRLCDCRERGITGCTCDRYHSQPDCDIGYDSSRHRYYFGYDLYLFSDPSSGHDLPIFPFLGPASRHDSHGFVHAWYAARSLKPDFHAQRMILDSAHDALAIYGLLHTNGVQALIDLNKGHSTPLDAKGYTIGPDGIPVCAQGHAMKQAGFDKAQHRLKYRCPKMSTRNGEPVCSCDSPCTDAKYGRQVHVYPESNRRLFCDPPRGTDAWKKAYNARTGSERANNRIKGHYNYESGKHRSSKQWYARLFITMMCIHLDAWPSVAENTPAA